MKYEMQWKLNELAISSLEDACYAIRLWQEACAACRERLPQSRVDGDLICIEQLTGRLRELSSFAHCLTAEDVRNEPAIQLVQKVHELEAELEIVVDAVDRKLLHLTEGEFSALILEEPFREIAPLLARRRRQAKEKMAVEREKLASLLSVDGYHGWKGLYDALIGAISIEIAHKEVSGRFSCGQAANLLAHPNREVREAIFHGMEREARERKELFAATLNHIIGFRLHLYRERGWDSPLKDALRMNRMQEKTLTTMWREVERVQPYFRSFLKRKAELHGLGKLAWFDREAPLGKRKTDYAYAQGAKIVEQEVSRFGPEFGAFCRKAFSGRWVEAEDRPHKAPGGFCTPFPLSQESRIFMTYSGTLDNVLVLAHELGHAYHNEVVFSLPALAQDYPMNLAETASTLFELMVFDGIAAACTDPEEKIALLHNRAQRSLLFFMDIYARFLFEESFFRERAQGTVMADRLSALMEAAQEKAFGGELASYHPYYWVHKLHFYLTDYPAYNFPYTFGYLFSWAIYARAKKDPAWFSSWYTAFLRDTGTMDVEALAEKHFGADITEGDFWREALEAAVDDVSQFLLLTEGRTWKP